MLHLQRLVQYRMIVNIHVNAALHIHDGVAEGVDLLSDHPHSRCNALGRRPQIQSVVLANPGEDQDPRDRWAPTRLQIPRLSAASQQFLLVANTRILAPNSSQKDHRLDLPTSVKVFPHPSRYGVIPEL